MFIKSVHEHQTFIPFMLMRLSDIFIATTSHFLGTNGAHYSKYWFWSVWWFYRPQLITRTKTLLYITAIYSHTTLKENHAIPFQHATKQVHVTRVTTTG